MKHPLLFSAVAASLLGIALALFIIGILSNNFYYALPFILIAWAVIIYERIRAYMIDKAKKEYYKKAEVPKV